MLFLYLRNELIMKRKKGKYIYSRKVPGIVVETDFLDN